LKKFRLEVECVSDPHKNDKYYTKVDYLHLFDEPTDFDEYRSMILDAIHALLEQYRKIVEEKVKK